MKLPCKTCSKVKECRNNNCKKLNKFFSADPACDIKPRLSNLLVFSPKEIIQILDRQQFANRISLTELASNQQLNYQDIEAIDKLTENEKEILIRFCVYRWSHKRLAKLFNISEGASRVRLYRAKKKLKQILGRKHETNS